MKSLIKLTTPNERTIWVNPNYISTICSIDNGSSVVCIGEDPNPIEVVETPETIIQKISVLK